MALQFGDIEMYYGLFPRLICIFTVLRNTNYANACTLMYLQYRYFVDSNHPILPTLRSHFHAFSEENCETAIHSTKTHVRDSNNSMENISKCWRENGAANQVFEYIGIKKSHKVSKTKRVLLSEDLWTERMRKVETELLTIEENIEIGVHDPFNQNIHRFTKNAARSEDTRRYDSLLNKLINRFSLGDAFKSSIREKLVAEFQDGSIDTINLENLYF